MNNPFFEFLIVIVIVGSVTKLLMAWMRSKESRRSSDESANENAALIQQLERLEERVRVLERIVTDDRFELKQQFKDLAR
jgi:phage shock protein B